MNKYILKRLLELIPVLILVSIFSFFIIQASPGDPIDNYVRPGMTEEQIEDIKEYELNGTLAQQYFRWMSHIMRGDLGTSIHQNRPVVDIIAERLPATLMLMGTALVFSLIVAIPLGLWAGLRKNKRSDNIISLISYLGISIPPFWLAMIGIILFSLKLHLLPSGGIHTVNVNTAADLLWHMILPAFVLSLNNMAIFTRYIRSNTISQLEEDYVQRWQKVPESGKFFSGMSLRIVFCQSSRWQALILRGWYAGHLW